MGTAIGCRFTGIPLRRVMDVLMTGAFSTLFMLVTAMVAAVVIERLTGLPFQALVLALAPGGLAEMSLISLTMGIDTAFVSTHHLVRICLLVVVAPMIFRMMIKVKKAPPA
jgi:hypothetical protein